MSNFVFKTLFIDGLYKNVQNFSDATLQTVDGGIFHVHKVILANRSEYFRLLFNFDVNRKEFCIPGIERRILEQVLVFIYTNRLAVSLDIIPALLVASDYLLFEKLATECCCYAIRNLNLKTCMLFLNVAHTINKLPLFEQCFRFLQLHFQDIVENSANELGLLDFDLIKKILAEKSLNISSEHTKWNTILIWIEHDLSERLEFVPELLTYLDTENIDESLAARIITHSIVSKNKYCGAITELKTDAYFPHFNMLSTYIQLQSNAVISEKKARVPSYLNIIINFCGSLEQGGVNVFLTFDEKLDVCQQICHLDILPDRLLISGHKLILRDKNHAALVWDLVENVSIPDSRTFHSFIGDRFCATLTNGNIYSIEEKGWLFSNAMERYSPEADKWDFVTSMMPSMCISAVISYCDKIFVFGFNRNIIEYEMLAQKYDPETDTWYVIAPPIVSRKYFAIVKHKNKILLIGGITVNLENCKDVEEYDPETNSWKLWPQLPFPYTCPNSKILNDTVYVYEADRFSENPPVLWDELHQNWQLVEKHSPFFHLKKYLFCPIKNSETVKKILLNRRNSLQKWVKSPFA